MAVVPTTITTFLFTDVERSTTLWELYPAKMRAALRRHEELVASSIRRYGGRIFGNPGDAFCAAFGTPAYALLAAVEAQQALSQEPWDPEIDALRVRMALHSGMAEERNQNHYGRTVNRVARLLSISHGGQILLSGSTYELVQDDLPNDVTVLDQGMHRLKDLLRPERVFQVQTAHIPLISRPLKSLGNYSHNLPIQLTSFIGHEDTLVNIKNLLAQTRLLTIKGEGGSGKTRIALQAAAELIDQYSDGVQLIRLETWQASDDIHQIAQAIATELHIREQPGFSLSQTVERFLHSKSMLLILDNCEHIVHACSLLTHALLQSCQELTILATSREALRVDGEAIVNVRPLRLETRRQLKVISPHALRTLLDTEAIRLFCDRASLVQTGFRLNAVNARPIMQICAYLGGVPLLIEWAAALVSVLTPEQIAIRLEDLSKLPPSDSRTAPPRQQSLTRLIDWSYEPLSEPERTLLRRLAVFMGSFTLSAAEVVCSDDIVPAANVLDLLTILVRKSLIQTGEDDHEQRHYHLSAPLRHYCRQRWVDADELQSRHLNWFLRFAEEAEEHLRGPEQALWLERLTAQHDDLRAALSWAKQTETRLRLAGALWRFWFIRGHFSEGRKWLEEGIDASNPTGGSDLTDLHVDLQRRTKALNGAGVLATQQGDYAAAQRLHEACLDLRRQCHDTLGIAHSLSNLGSVHFNCRDYAAARSLFEESLSTYRAVNNIEGIGLTLNNLGVTAMNVQDLDFAVTCFVESLEIHRAAGDNWKITVALYNLGTAAWKRPDDELARHYLDQCLPILRQLGDDACTAQCLFRFGLIAFRKNDDQRAARLLAAAITLKDAVGIVFHDNDTADLERCKNELPARMGNQEFRTAWADGETMSLDLAVAYALDDAEAT